MAEVDPNVIELVAKALGVPTDHEDVKVCIDVLRGELVRDMDTLKEAWDELKHKMPALARARMNPLLHTQYQVTEITAVSPTVWAKNGVICLLIFVGPCTLGALAWDEASSAESYDDSLLYTVWLPMAALLVLEVLVGAYLAPKIGWDMIVNASEDADLREALKNSMTTQGFIAALFLTVVWAMLQADPIQDDSTLILSQWYTGLLVLSIALTLIGTLASVTCLLFLEPLTGDAALDMVFNNFMYFGEPLALSGFGFVNSMFATILWVFGKYGSGLGSFSVLCFFYATLRSMVIYDYMVTWQNPELDGLLKDLRKNIKSTIEKSSRSVAKQAVVVPTHSTGTGEPNTGAPTASQISRRKP